MFQGAVFQEAKCAEKCSRELSVKEQTGLRCKLFKGTKCRQNVLRSKMFWEAKSPKEENVLRSKVCVSQQPLCELDKWKL